MKWPRNAAGSLHGSKGAPSPSPMVWGHRGASAAALQNSPEAFRLAKEWGAAGVELDIRRTVDGALVVHHDANLSDGRLIIETQADDLPHYVPSLAWVLQLYADRLVNIEVKSGPDEPDFDSQYPVVELLLEVLRSDDPSGRHIVTSFDAEVIDRMHTADPDRATGLISWDPGTAARLEAIAAAGHVAIMADRHLVDDAFMAAARGADLFVGVWTVNSTSEMQRLAQLGVNAIMTDHPDLALAEFAR